MLLEHRLPFRYASNRSLKKLISPFKVLPDFIIVGAQKSGTTSLYNYLKQHPNVFSTSKKEIEFFDWGFWRGEYWYRSYFPSIFLKFFMKKLCNKEFVTGEASPDYIFHPFAAQRIYEMLPKIKVILLLRNPIDRAYSHYHHRLRDGTETMSFEEAIKKEKVRLRGELQKILKNENYRSFNYKNYSYLTRGIYMNQLKPWMKFFNREQILILKSEDFFQNPRGVFNKATGFLNLPEWDLEGYRKFTHGKYKPMDARLRKKLVEYFKPHNKKLYKYLSCDFGWDR